jgi:hypothetical protein
LFGSRFSVAALIRLRYNQLNLPQNLVELVFEQLCKVTASLIFIDNLLAAEGTRIVALLNPIFYALGVEKVLPVTVQNGDVLLRSEYIPTDDAIFLTMEKSYSISYFAYTSQNSYLMVIGSIRRNCQSVITYTELIEYIDLSNNEEKPFETKGHHYNIIEVFGQINLFSLLSINLSLVTNV